MRGKSGSSPEEVVAANTSFRTADSGTRGGTTCSEWSCGIEGTPRPPTATTRCSASYTSCQRKPEGSDTKRARI